MRIPRDVMERQTYAAFPELQQFNNEIHFIDASINRRDVFTTRDTVEIVNEILEAKKQGRSKFMFFLFTEAVLSHTIFKIHRIAELLRGVIPPENFIYLSGAINGEEAYNNIASRLKFPFRISILSASMFHFSLLNNLDHYKVDCNFEVRINSKPKKFLCFNKVEREQRLVLLERMLENKLVDLGYYSFESTHSDNFSAFADMLPEEKFPNIKKHKNMFPLRLNITENRTNPVNILPEDMEYFYNSYFSIVNETLYYGFERTEQRPLHHQLNAEYSSIFISEKTYKCLAVKHPFIIFGRPGTINGLHKLGFKTFSPFFDESYDDIMDDDERFDAIFNEITRLINLSDNEWLDILTNIKPILEHNYEVFFNKTRYGVSDHTTELFRSDIK